MDRTAAERQRRYRERRNARIDELEAKLAAYDGRAEEEKVVETLDRSNEANAVTAYMFQLTGAYIAFRNCEKLLPMVKRMKKPPHAADWKELRLSTRQRAEQFADLSKKIEAATPRPSRRRKPILR
jgi:hypothetical protein